MPQILFGRIGQEFTPDPQRPPGELHQCLPARLDLRDMLAEQPGNMADIAGRAGSLT